MAKLTDTLLAKVAVESGRKDRLIFDDACPGLGVRVTAAGTRTFLVQWTDPITKKRVRERIGAWGSITIPQAREAARIRLGEVAKGGDPRADRLRKEEEARRQRAEQALTLDRLTDDWVSLRLEERSPRYRNEASRAIRHALRDFLNRPAANLTRADVTRVLDEMQRAGKKAMAARTLSYGRAAFQLAVRRGQAPANPFMGLPVDAALKPRDRVLSDEEVRAVWLASGALSYPWGPFYRLALLTLQRRDEVAGMRWSEIDLARGLWTIPAARMKNRKPHDIHLSQAAREVLGGIERTDSDLVFTSNGRTPISGFSKAKFQIVKEAEFALGLPSGSQPSWRLHDFRRTGVSALAKLGVDSIVADKLLAHQPAKLSGVAAVYQRYDFASERARALDSWADYIIGLAAQGARSAREYATEGQTA